MPKPRRPLPNVAPPELTDAQRGEIKALLDLLAADHTQFDAQIRAYVNNPDHNGAVIFRSPDLAIYTLDGIRRLITDAERRRAQYRDPKERRRLLLFIRALNREKEAIKPFVHIAATIAARKDSRARAEKVLGRVLYPLLAPVIRDIEEGRMSADQAEQALRERLARNGKGRP